MIKVICVKVMTLGNTMIIFWIIRIKLHSGNRLSSREAGYIAANQAILIKHAKQKKQSSHLHRLTSSNKRGQSRASYHKNTIRNIRENLLKSARW